ncbi:hypothetical protein Tco_1576510 [Tanacetum coccineum]
MKRKPWMTIDEVSRSIEGLGYGIKSNAEVLGYEEEISRGIFAFRETNAGYNDIPLYSRFKQVEYKGVPHPLSGDYTPREQEDIDDSLYEYGKYGLNPQSPSPTKSDASSTVYSTCQSNDSDGEQGTVSDHSVNDDPIPIPSIEQVTIATQKTQPQVPKPQQTVDPSCAQHVKTPRQPIRTPVTPSPIPSYNRQNWNQRMERELGQEHAAQAQSQPLPPPPPIPSPTPTPIPTSTSPPPIIPSPTPPPIPTPTSPPPPPPETEPPTDEHIYEEQSPVHHHFSPHKHCSSTHAYR